MPKKLKCTVLLELYDSSIEKWKKVIELLDLNETKKASKIVDEKCSFCNDAEFRTGRTGSTPITRETCEKCLLSNTNICRTSSSRISLSLYDKTIFSREEHGEDSESFRKACADLLDELIKERRELLKR